MRIRLIAALMVLLMISVGVLAVHRRATRSDPVCPPVTLTLSASPRTVCQSSNVTLSWQASDPRAQVVIDGISGTQPASGSFLFFTGPRTFSGHASLACGAGPAGSTSVTAAASPSGSLSGPSSSIAQNSTTTLHVTAIDAVQWTISSALGNPLSPNVGTASRDVSYTASQSGSDTVTVRLVSACGEETLRSVGFSITPAPQPPPPPPTSGLRCCDGTFSPTCTSCAHKQGCCSSHGGVCGC